MLCWKSWKEASLWKLQLSPGSCATLTFIFRGWDNRLTFSFLRKKYLVKTFISYSYWTTQRYLIQINSTLLTVGNYWQVKFKALMFCPYVTLWQDWRLNVLGKIPDPRAELLNRLEEKWERERDFGDQWILCDQLIMAVALDENCVVESQNCHVSFLRDHVVLFLSYKHKQVFNISLNETVLITQNRELAFLQGETWPIIVTRLSRNWEE